MKTITLADGPHLLDAPRVPAFIYLQRLGYKVADLFNRALMTGEGDDIEPDLQSFADHICALLIASEPQVGWTPEKVADLMVIDNLDAYYTTIRDLAFEGDGGADPKASSPTTPSEEQS